MVYTPHPPLVAPVQQIICLLQQQKRDRSRCPGGLRLYCHKQTIDVTCVLVRYHQGHFGDVLCGDTKPPQSCFPPSSHVPEELQAPQPQPAAHNVPSNNTWLNQTICDDIVCDDERLYVVYVLFCECSIHNKGSGWLQRGGWGPPWLFLFDACCIELSGVRDWV